MRTYFFYALLIICSVVFLFSGGAKLLGLEEAIRQNRTLNLDDWFIRLIGFFEVGGVVGLWFTKLRTSAAIGLMLIMIGAIGTHVGAAQPQHVVPATILFCLTLLIILLDPKTIIIIKR